MNNTQAQDMIMELLGEVDYDVMKSLDPETAEEPEEAERQMKRLIKIVQRHIKNHSK